MQIHHIDDDPSNNEQSNLAVVCLQHHSEAHVRGGMDRKLTPALLRKYRLEWVARVKGRRERADRIAASESAIEANLSMRTLTAEEALRAFNAATLSRLAYIRNLPHVKKLAYERARPEWDSGITSRMMWGTSEVIGILEQVWVHLAGMYPPGHFGPKTIPLFIDEYLRGRSEWHSLIDTPVGPASTGTLVRLGIVAHVLADIEAAVVETVMALTEMDIGDFDFVEWKKEWEAASWAACGLR